MKDLLKITIVLGSIYMFSALVTAPFAPDPNDDSLDYACMNIVSLSNQERDHYQSILDSNPGYPEIQLEIFCEKWGS